LRVRMMALLTLVTLGFFTKMFPIFAGEVA
jgi:hypothetical protein